jgi:hypothetical protein
MGYQPDAADRRPGVLPDIRANGEDVVFQFLVALGKPAEAPRLVLRCDSIGNVWAALRRSDRGE